jgi:hypothetical protein
MPKIAAGPHACRQMHTGRITRTIWRAGRLMHKIAAGRHCCRLMHSGRITRSMWLAGRLMRPMRIAGE